MRPFFLAQIVSQKVTLRSKSERKCHILIKSHHEVCQKRLKKEPLLSVSEHGPIYGKSYIEKGRCYKIYAINSNSPFLR